MGSSLALLSLLFLACTAGTSAYAPMTLTVVNNCPYTIWPAIQPSAGSGVLEGGGFELSSLAYRSFPVPDAPWSGRIWARTGCRTSQAGRFTCATGDCGGLLQCQGAGGAPPASLAQLNLHQSGAADHVSYGVSFVDGFNVPMTITPHLGQGQCPVVGCKAQLLDTCPTALQHRSAVGGGGGSVLGCKSGCLAFNTDELCCRGRCNSPRTCRPSSYSTYFKTACPDTYTYAYDSPAVPQDCAAPGELKVIFCH